MAVNLQFRDPGNFSYCDTAMSWCGDKPKDVFKFFRDGLKWVGHCLDTYQIDSSSTLLAAGQFNDAQSFFNFPSFIKDLGDVNKVAATSDAWRLSEKLGLTVVHGVGCFKIIDKIMNVSNVALMQKLDRTKDVGGLVSGFISSWDAYRDWCFANTWEMNRPGLDQDRVNVVSSFRSTKCCLVAFNIANIAFSVLGLAGALFAIKASSMTLLAISTVGILAGMAKYTYEKVHEHAFRTVLFRNPQNATQLDRSLRPASFRNYI